MNIEPNITAMPQSKIGDNSILLNSTKSLFPANLCPSSHISVSGDVKNMLRHVPRAQGVKNVIEGADNRIGEEKRERYVMHLSKYVSFYFF